MSETLSKLKPYIVGLPKKPSDLTRAEAKVEFDELMAKKPTLIAYFEGVLKGAGIDVALPSENLVCEAGEWLVRNGRLEKGRSLLPARFGAGEDEDLSVPTKSAACYLGLLLGERIVDSVPGTAWVLVTDNKRDMDYHRAVIRPKSNKTQVDPIRIAINFVHARLDKSHSKRLGEFYKLWCDALSSH